MFFLLKGYSWEKRKISGVLEYTSFSKSGWIKKEKRKKTSPKNFALKISKFRMQVPYCYIYRKKK